MIEQSMQYIPLVIDRDHIVIVLLWYCIIIMRPCNESSSRIRMAMGACVNGHITYIRMIASN